MYPYQAIRYPVGRGHRRDDDEGNLHAHGRVEVSMEVVETQRALWVLMVSAIHCHMEDLAYHQVQPDEEPIRRLLLIDSAA